MEEASFLLGEDLDSLSLESGWTPQNPVKVGYWLENGRLSGRDETVILVNSGC